MGDGSAVPPPAVPAGIAARNRAAARMSVLTLVSRGTGFARVMVVAAVLGTSYLGNVYQSANMVPNILFELFAAGILQSILVPIMVDAVDRASAGEAERIAGVVLGAILSLLGAIVAVGMVTAPLLIRMLVSGVDDPAIRDAQVQLGLFLLWFFLPQVVFYAVNLVATAVLNAKGYFGLPVFAPTVNNVIVIGVYLLFAHMRGGSAPSLELTLAEKLVLGLGTTLGVVAFCFVPVVGLMRTGFSLRPRIDLRHPVLKRLLRQGMWAAGFLAFTQLLLVGVLVLANGVEGGVVVYQLAFVLFMLPHSLFAVPVFTTAFPAMTRDAVAASWSGFAEEVGRATRSIALFTMVSAAALVALAGPLSQVIALGNASTRTADVASAIVAFSLGLPGFSMLLFLTRVAYARSDTRTPTVVNLAVLVVGVAAMVVLTRVMDAGDRVAAIGLGYSLAQTLGAVLLGLVLRAQLHGLGAAVEQVVLPLARTALASTVAAFAVRRLVTGLDPAGMATSIAVAAVGGLAVVAVAVAAVWVAGGPTPIALARTLGAAPGRGGPS